MQTEPTGSAGRSNLASSPANVIKPEEGSHHHREVSEKQGLMNSITRTSSESTFQTLKQRGIKPKSLSCGAVSTIASVLTPMALAGMDVSARKARGSLKKDIDALKAKHSQGIKRKPVAVKELSRVNKKLGVLRSSLSGSMSSKQLKEYMELYESADSLHRELIELEATESWYGAQQDLRRSQLDQFDHQTKQMRTLIKEGVHAGAKVIGGLRNVYQPDPDSASKSEVRVMNLGDLKIEDQGHYSVSLQDMSVAIERFQRNEDGSVTLNVAECSAKCTALDQCGNVTGPVRFQGGLKVTVKEPLAELIDQLMQCSLVRLPFCLKGMTADFEKKAQKALGHLNGKKPDIRDYIDFEVSALNIDDEESGRIQSILSRQGVEIILNLLNPVVSSYKDMADDKLQAGIKAGSATLSLETQRREMKMDRLGGLIKSMEADINLLSGDKVVLRESLNESVIQLKGELARAQESLGQYANARDGLEKRMRVNEKWRKSERNEWVEGYTNLSNVLLALREAVNSTSDANPVTLKCPLQRIPLGAMAHLDIEGLEVSISSVDLDEAGILTISIPEMKARLSFENDLTSETRDTPVTLKGLRIKIEPPLGLFVRDTLKLDFPLDVRRLQKLNELMTEIWPSMENSAVNNGTDAHAKDPKLNELLHLNIEDVSISRDGTEECCSDEYEVDRQALSQSSSQLLGTEVKADSYEQIMGQLLKPDSSEFKKLMHFLAMSVMGVKGALPISDEPKVVSLPDEEAISISSGMDSGIEVDLENETESIQSVPVIDSSSIEESLPNIPDASFLEGGSIVESTTIPPTVPEMHQESLDMAESSSNTDMAIQVNGAVAEDKTFFEQDMVQISVENIEVITTEELRSTEGLHPSFIFDQNNMPKAVFELQTNLDTLFGKISWFWRLLIGSMSVGLEVQTTQSRRGVELQNPRVRIKNGGIIRRFAVNRLLKTAMKKRRVSLAVDYSGEKRKIGLVLDTLTAVAIKS
ncbi:hypothetical protein [Endozoicomonas numazuensis]|uniref:Uncharacterized protein n=1 Tax=Endozoicomonas numazuensis TaxID=1137799 RepID=A0A081N9D4_9GAMM|nr:hypothetical protein [Endozoicomonas numazuensis]KEQ15057.1 hypothetical protein GZ78_24600 [Endozoicomonas numazuensis]